MNMMRTLLLIVLPLALCSCVTYTYTFEPEEPGEIWRNLADDSLVSCTFTSRPTTYNSPYITLRILRKGAREILVKSLISRIAPSSPDDRVEGSPGTITPSRMLPHTTVWTTHLHAVRQILDLEPEFRVLSEVGGTGGLSYDIHYRRLPDEVGDPLLRIDLVLLVDGVERILTRDMKLIAHSKAHRGTLRVAH